jgi:hypothetical protein
VLVDGRELRRFGYPSEGEVARLVCRALPDCILGFRGNQNFFLNFFHTKEFGE